jgi:hypothetical protein
MHADQMQVRGYFVLPILAFVDGLDPAMQGKISDLTRDVDRDALRAMPPSGWTSLPPLQRLIDAIVTAHGGESAALEVCDRLGRSIADAATSTLLRLFMKIATPSMVAKQMKPLWRKYFSSGDFEIEQLRPTGAVYALVGGWKYAPGLGRGWMGYVMDAIGKRDVKVVSEPASGILPEPGGRVRWTIDWAS